MWFYDLKMVNDLDEYMVVFVCVYVVLLVFGCPSHSASSQADEGLVEIVCAFRLHSIV